MLGSILALVAGSERARTAVVVAAGTVVAEVALSAGTMVVVAARTVSAFATRTALTLNVALGLGSEHAH